MKLYAKQKNSLDNQIIIMSNVIARKNPKNNKTKEFLTHTEKQLFYMALSQANTVDEKGIVKLLKKDVFEKLGIDDSNMYTRYRELFNAMILKTYYEFDKEDGWKDGFLIYQVEADRDYFYLYFNVSYIPLLQNLDQSTTMFFDDIMKFDCTHSIPLYQFLRSLNKHPLYHNYYEFSTRDLKELFGLSDDDYMRKSGGFDRANFEKYTIEKAIDEINEKATLIKNIKIEKVKKGRRVAYYKVTFENQKLVSSNAVDVIENVDVELPASNEESLYNTIPESNENDYGYSIDKEKPSNNEKKVYEMNEAEYREYKANLSQKEEQESLFKRLRHVLNCLDNPTDAQLEEIYELATEVVEPDVRKGPEDWDWRMFNYLKKKNLQIKAYPNPVKSPYGLLKKIITADAVETESED